MGQRARLVLLAEHASDLDVAKEVGVSRVTVRKWRRMFDDVGIEGLFVTDERRSPPARIPEEKLQLALTARDTLGPHAKPWTTRAMAKATGLSQSSVSRIWRQYELRPKGARDPNTPPKRRKPVMAVETYRWREEQLAELRRRRAQSELL